MACCGGGGAEKAGATGALLPCGGWTVIGAIVCIIGMGVIGGAITFGIIMTCGPAGPGIP